jgi:hypothetical protein
MAREETREEVAAEWGVPLENVTRDRDGRGFSIRGPFPEPEPKDSHEHGAIEASDLTEDEIRAAIVARATEIVTKWPVLVSAVQNDNDRRGLSSILANLNAAAMHISDFYGC